MIELVNLLRMSSVLLRSAPDFAFAYRTAFQLQRRSLIFEASGRPADTTVSGDLHLSP
jgi:hypothetical protein